MSWKNLYSEICDQVRLKLVSSATEGLEISGIIISRQRKTNVLFRLCYCIGWSASMLFAYGINWLSHDMANIYHIQRSWQSRNIQWISYILSVGISYCIIEPLMTKPAKWHVRPAKTQISLGICPIWSESSLSAWRKLGSLATHWAHSEDTDQTGRIPRLICVFAGGTIILLVVHEAAHIR